MEILIIEDNSGDLILIKELLYSSGLSIRNTYCCDSVLAASEILSNKSIDIIFLDLTLPDSSGLETLTKLTAIRNDIPIIILSGLDDEKVAVETLKLGAQDYLVKGEYNIKLLVKTVQYSIERKKNYDALNYLNNELNTFLYKASHDLKGPVLSIIGLTDIAKKTFKDKNTLLYFDKIEYCAKKNEKILQNLFDLTVIRQGNPKLESVNMQDLIQSIIETITVTENSIDFVFDMPDCAAINTDYMMLHSVLKNVIDNAVKYRKQHGDNQIVRIEFIINEKHNTISITDNGQGIAHNYIDKVYDMFYKANQSSEGSGLGLYIAKTFIDKLQGSIAISSQLGEGTTVKINLPKHIRN